MIKIIIDSTTGLSQKEAHKIGFGYLPLSIIAGTTKYNEGIDVDSEWVANQLEKNVALSTSQPSIGTILNVFEKETKINDEIIVLTMSAHLSGTYANVLQASQEFKNIHVIDTRTVGPAIQPLALWAKNAAKKMNVNDIISGLEDKIKISKTFLLPDNMDQIKKSGRISPAVAAMAKFIGILPILQIKNGKIVKFGKTRSKIKGIKKIINALKDVSQDFETFNVTVFSTPEEEVKIACDLIKQELGKKANVKELPASLSWHVGKGAIGFTTGNYSK